MAAIGTLTIVALLAAILFYYGFILIGSVSTANNLNMSSYVSQTYNAINGNTVNANNPLLTNVSALTQAGQTTGQTLQNPNLGTGLFSALGLAANFLTSLPNLVLTEINIIAVGLTAFGVPYTFALAVVWGIIILIIALAILSAWFIFPIL